MNSSVIQVGNEKVLYATIPYKGCTVIPKCLFCGVREQADRTLSIDEDFGKMVRENIMKLLSDHSPDTLVLYNGGNLLRPVEMYQPTVMTDIPNYIAGHSSCNAYEIEVRADDILNFKANLKLIKENLHGKMLRVRLGIEYYDDKLLKRHKKGVDMSQISEAVKTLNELDIEWNGYAMFGGLDMTKSEAVDSAIKTGKFILENNAYKLSINGMFVTTRLNKGFGDRIYVPDYDDLVTVLSELCKYKAEIGSNTLFKVGFEEEDTKDVVRLPYINNSSDSREIIDRLGEFNKTQDIKKLCD